MSPRVQISLLARSHSVFLKMCGLGHKPLRDVMNSDMVQRRAIKMLAGKESLLFEDELKRKTKQ